MSLAVSGLSYCSHWCYKSWRRRHASRLPGLVHCDTSTHRRIDQIDEFVGLIVASGLVDARQMRQFLSDFNNSLKQSSRCGDTITAFSAFLVSREVLTRWQVEKIRQGKYKGFFEIAEYRLLEHLCHTERSTTYRAENTTTRQVVALDVSINRSSGKIQHQVSRVYDD